MERLSIDTDTEETPTKEWRPAPAHLERLETGRVPAGSSLERALAYVPVFSGGFHITEQDGVCASTELPMDEKVYFMNHPLS